MYCDGNVFCKETNITLSVKSQCLCDNMGQTIINTLHDNLSVFIGF
jgi:hypothetical protein